MGTITDVAGIKVGHWTDRQGGTGCTVILCPEGAVAGVDVRGSAPGTRETDLLRPMNLVEKVHAILLSGGSAFGLDAAGGVMRFLEERGAGYQTSVARVPIVPAAILYDLSFGDPKARPGPEEGYQACRAARGGRVAEGCVGAGTGATVGKVLGQAQATKAGLGTASCSFQGVVVGALAAVNAFGDVVDPETGSLLAGPRSQDGKGFLSTSQLLKERPAPAPFATSTTLGVVATDAALTKEQVNKLAQMAHDGLARAIRPAHTMADGDVIFALSLGQRPANLTALGTAAAEVMAEAIVRGVTQAQGLLGLPSRRDWVGE